MTTPDPIRAALERLHQYAETFPEHDSDAIVADARAALDAAPPDEPPAWRGLISRMADELDHCLRLVVDDRREVHPLAEEARAALEATPPAPTAGEVELLVIAIQALTPHQPDVNSHHLGAIDRGCEILRNALARWGLPATTPAGQEGA